MYTTYSSPCPLHLLLQARRSLDIQIEWDACRRAHLRAQGMASDVVNGTQDEGPAEEAAL